jgi:DNA-binding transcriptional LysR family regulator
VGDLVGQAVGGGDLVHGTPDVVADVRGRVEGHDAVGSGQERRHVDVVGDRVEVPLDPPDVVPVLVRGRVPGGQSLWDEDLDKAGIGRSVEATASSFVAMPYMLAGTELVTLLAESLGKRVASSAEIVLLEPDMPITPLHQSMYWHARRDRDPGHAWLREQIRAVSHA